jgi:hypothetical protein
MSERALVDNAADPGQVQNAKNVTKRKQRQETVDLRDVSNTPAGERLCERLISDFGLFRTSFSTDPLQMAYDEGRRNAGLKFLALLTEANPPIAARILTRALTPETPE